jgi:hypothetical protein
MIKSNNCASGRVASGWRNHSTLQAYSTFCYPNIWGDAFWPEAPAHE